MSSSNLRRETAGGAVSRLGYPDLGDGVGLRETHFPYLRHHPPEQWGVDWFEIITENFFDNHGWAAEMLDHVVAHRPVVMHGVSLSIGSTDPLNLAYLHKVRALAERIHPVWISDHLCWTGINGRNTHDLLPMPLTAESLDHTADRIRAVQDFLGRPLIVENPSSYLEYSASTIPECDFLASLTELTGCGLLLDVNNVFVSATNHGFDPMPYLDALPAEKIVQIHLAGPTDCGAYLLDTHDQPVARQVWPLYAKAQALTGGVATLLEWDSNIPAFPDLVLELMKAREVRAGREVEAGPPRPPAGSEPVSTPIDFQMGGFQRDEAAGERCRHG